MAGVSARQIKSRIRSMEATRKITRAMELVASSKLRKAQAQLLSSRPYFEALTDTLNRILAVNRDLSSPYLRVRPGNRVLYVVIAGDRGLAGGYNGNILKRVHEEIRDMDTVVLPIGRKAADFFRAQNIPILTEVSSVAADLGIDDCFSVAEHLCRGFLEGEFDEVHLAYTGFVSVLAQAPATRKLLPLTPEAANGPFRGDTIYEPDPETVFAAIVPGYLGGILYGALCESRAAEAAARRNAMDSATQNAEERIADLKLVFNRARQAAITQEITEIVAGAQ